jgi:hypothetical protein
LYPLFATANLPPVSTTLAVPVAKFSTDVVDTTGGNRNILEKFKMILMLFLGAWEKMIHQKNLKHKIL